MPLRSPLFGLLAFALPSSLALITAGCAAPVDSSEADDAIGIYQQPIKGGYNDTTDTGVVGIYDSSIGAECSGSLIAPNVVLTARHCVSDTSETVQCGQAKPGSLHAAKYFLVTTQPTFSFDPKDYHKVREVIGLPLDAASNDPLLNKEDLCGRDQALLILEDNILPEEAIPYIPRVDLELVAGEEYYAVGFGATNDSGGGAGTRRRRDDLFVACVGAQCPSAYVKTTEFIGDTGICQGDSGGPSLDMANRVVGVTSRGSFGCDDPVYGAVFGWGQWLKDVVLYAAQPAIGNYDAPPWANGKSTDPAYGGAVGVSCDAAECTSNICINTGTKLGEYCSHKCDDVNTCPDDFKCDAELGACKHAPASKPKPNETSGGGDGGSGNESSEGGCSLAVPDPTKPVPWKTGALIAGAVGAMAMRRRRRRA